MYTKHSPNADTVTTHTHTHTGFSTRLCQLSLSFSFSQHSRCFAVTVSVICQCVSVWHAAFVLFVYEKGPPRSKAERSAQHRHAIAGSRSKTTRKKRNIYIYIKQQNWTRFACEKRWKYKSTNINNTYCNWKKKSVAKANSNTHKTR